MEHEEKAFKIVNDVQHKDFVFDVYKDQLKVTNSRDPRKWYENRFSKYFEK